MMDHKTFHAVTDDTALVANISEIKRWVTQGHLTLVIPVCTLERLHILKRDASQIGINAREALKFLDRVTSGKDNVPETSIQLQGPDDRFQTWEEVEAQFKGQQDAPGPAGKHGAAETAHNAPGSLVNVERSSDKASNAPRTTSSLSQLLLDKLNFAKEPEVASNASTPPTSPSSSNLQSTKTSPEVSTSKPVAPKPPAKVANGDMVIVPHAYRPLINSAIFLLKHQPNMSVTYKESFMLTNDTEMGSIARKFGLSVKNIHQLRASVSSESQEAKNRSKYQKKHSPKPSLSSNEPKPKTLFSYEDDDEDEVVFLPRSNRGALSSRGRLASKKSNNELRRSVESNAPPPQIPTEEIDPDSFDRGAFSRARPPTPTGQIDPKEHGGGTGRGGRGGFGSRSPGKTTNRGQFRGSGRGSARGNGKLFIP